MGGSEGGAKTARKRLACCVHGGGEEEIGVCLLEKSGVIGRGSVVLLPRTKATECGEGAQVGGFKVEVVKL